MSNAELRAKLKSPEFLELLKARNNEAVSQIVCAYTEQLLKASIGLGFADDQGQELVQRVWITFFDVIQGFKGQSHVRTFLFGIFYNKAAELRRENVKHGAGESIEDILEEKFDVDGAWTKAPLDPEEFLLAAETKSLIEKCLEALPVSQRMAFFLREVEGEETPEICKILDVSVTNLGVLFYRAKNGLRECIEGKARTKNVMR